LGFFGPTSFSAAYLEMETTLAVQGPSVASEAMPSPHTLLSEAMPPSLAEIEDMTNRDQTASHLAVRVLQAIPTCEETAAATFRLPINSEDAWMRMISERLVASTWETYGPYLRAELDIYRMRADSDDSFDAKSYEYRIECQEIRFAIESFGLQFDSHRII
jgi:hypothetical protein